MKIYLQGSQWGLIPSDTESAENLDKVLKRAKGSPFVAEVKIPRNLKMHRKYFKLLDVVFDQQEIVSNRDVFRRCIAIYSGHCDIVEVGGDIQKIPRSIAFTNCTQEEFEELYSNTIDVCLKYFCNGTKQSLESQIENIMGFV